MSVIGPEGEKVGGAPSVDGDHVEEVSPLPPMEDQIVIRGKAVSVPPKPHKSLYVAFSKIHDLSARAARSFVAVPGSAERQRPVAKTRVMVDAPIHDRAERPSFVVNLGDVDGPPRPPMPQLGPTPISIQGFYDAPAYSKPGYSGPEAPIHGVPHEETEQPEPDAFYFVFPPIEAKIHDFGNRTVAL
jgi:hypothetical protein